MTPFKLFGRVDSASHIDERDALQTKGALKKRGYYKTPRYGMTQYPDEQMFDGIWSYQRANMLQVDGVMKPGGETERTIKRGLEASTGHNDEKPQPSGSNMPVFEPPNIDKNMPILNKPFLPKPKDEGGIYSRPGVDEDGNIILDGKNPKTGKPIRPPIRI